MTGLSFNPLPLINILDDIAENNNDDYVLYAHHCLPALPLENINKVLAKFNRTYRFEQHHEPGKVWINLTHKSQQTLF